MFHIFVVIAFVCFSIRFFHLAVTVAWGFSKVVASLFFTLAIPALFISVVIQNVVFLLLPLAFLLTAIDVLAPARQVS